VAAPTRTSSPDAAVAARMLALATVCSLRTSMCAARTHLRSAYHMQAQRDADVEPRGPGLRQRCAEAAEHEGSARVYVVGAYAAHAWTQCSCNQRGGGVGFQCAHVLPPLPHDCPLPLICSTPNPPTCSLFLTVVYFFVLCSQHSYKNIGPPVAAVG